MLARLIAPLIAFLDRLVRGHPCACVLMYHDISDRNDEYSMLWEKLCWQIADMKARGFTFVPAEKIVNWKPENGRWCAVTFDDGYPSCVRLSELDVPVTIFIPTNPDLAELHTTVAMNTKNLVEKLKNAPNISFGSHGVTHRKWTRLSPDELARELEESHKTIGTWSGKPVTTCAYPKGSMNETVANAVRRHYIHAFLADGGPITAPIKDVMRIPRIGIFAHDSKSMFRMRTSPILRPLLSLRSQWKR